MRSRLCLLGVALIVVSPTTPFSMSAQESDAPIDVDTVRAAVKELTERTESPLSLEQLRVVPLLADAEAFILHKDVTPPAR